MFGDISSTLLTTSDDQMDDYGDDEEINICNTCGHASDSIDDYGNDDHSSSVVFAPLSLEISKQLLFHKSDGLFERYQKQYPNAKCSFIKHMNRNIVDNEREIKLIQSIIDHKLLVIGKTSNEIFEQIEQLGFDRSFYSVFNRLHVCDLCEEKNCISP
jgi:hypothetical protein